MMNSGTGSYALGFFIVPMGEELEISRKQFSLIPLFKLVTIPILPVLGMMVDRKYGARLIVTIGTLSGGLALVLTSQINTVWQFYIIYGILYGLATSAMGAQLIGPSLISKWFITMRGRAMAIGTMGISAGGVVIAPLAGVTVSMLGWRASWIVLGIVAIVSIVPVSSLFIRRSPEDIGLLPDGVDKEKSISEPTLIKEARSWTLKQVIKTKTFWILTVVQSLGLCGLVSVLFHEIPYIQDKGFTTGSAAIVATSLAASAMISKLPFGYLSDKFDIRFVLAICFIPAGISTLLILPSSSLITLIGWGIFHGFFMGGFPTITGVAFPAYFGRQHLGSIRGALSPITMIVSASSPLIGGLLWSNKYSYSIPFVVFGLAWIIGGLLPLLLKSPADHEAL